ncbi:MAG: hypothetical protein JW793_01320 [Acidobacteria bacterium]|nr:hypothetical protein [Acidobacteriota bacterium]
MKMQREPTAEVRNQAESAADISPRTVGVCIAGALIPGLGHAILGKWDRALVFLFSIACLFGMGLYLQGTLFSPAIQTVTALLKFFADAGAGLFYWIALLGGLGKGNPTSYTYDYANVFLYVAGLLNMLVVMDVFDIAMGRKQ